VVRNFAQFTFRLPAESEYIGYAIYYSVNRHIVSMFRNEFSMLRSLEVRSEVSMLRSEACDFLQLSPKLGTLDNSVPRGSNRIWPWDRGMPISATTKEKQDLYLPKPAQNPSPNSRLGDIGYLGDTGTWRRVVNVLDSTSCDQLGIKPLRSMQGLASEYITERRVHQREPIVNLYSDDARRVKKSPDWEYTPVYDGI